MNTKKTPFCPDEYLLYLYKNDELTEEGQKEVRQHLRDCRTCRQILNKLKSFHLEEIKADVPEKLRGMRPAPEKPLAEPGIVSPGQIWSLNSHAVSPLGELLPPNFNTPLVVVLEGEDIADHEKYKNIVVIPLSEEVDMATNYDLIIENPLLADRHIAQCWNYTGTIKDNLYHYFGSFPEKTMRQIRYLVNQAESKSEPKKEFEGEPLPIGKPILHPHDLRLKWQSSQVELMQYYNISAQHLFQLLEEEAREKVPIKERAKATLFNLVLK